MGCVIGCDAVNISYLYHKEQDCVKAGFRRPLQLPDVLDAPLRGGVREQGISVFLQCDALHLHQMKPSLRLDAKVQPGPAVSILRADGGDVRQETSGRRPLRKYLIGSLRVHIDKNATLFHRNQIVCGFSVGIRSLFQIDRAARHQQFPAPARILHMDGLHAAVQFHMGDKAVGAVNKFRRPDILIVHCCLLRIIRHPQARLTAGGCTS